MCSSALRGVNMSLLYSFSCFPLKGPKTNKHLILLLRSLKNFFWYQEWVSMYCEGVGLILELILNSTCTHFFVFLFFSVLDPHLSGMVCWLDSFCLFFSNREDREWNMTSLRLWCFSQGLVVTKSELKMLVNIRLGSGEKQHVFHCLQAGDCFTFYKKTKQNKT